MIQLIHLIYNLFNIFIIINQDNNIFKFETYTVYVLILDINT
jgi:hypothetical protein